MSAAKLRQELDDCRKALEDALGRKRTLFRTPFGGKRPNVLRTARAMGLQPIMWSVTAYDWSANSSEVIVRKITSALDSRRRPQAEIILLHDGSHKAFGMDRSHTVEATRNLLQLYANKRFVSISELTGLT